MIWVGFFVSSEVTTPVNWEIPQDLSGCCREYGRFVMLPHSCTAIGLCAPLLRSNCPESCAFYHWNAQSHTHFISHPHSRKEWQNSPEMYLLVIPILKLINLFCCCLWFCNLFLSWISRQVCAWSFWPNQKSIKVCRSKNIYYWPKSC